MPPKPLAKTAVKRKVTSALLESTMSQAEIAKSVGLSASAITRFKQRHEAELEERRKQLEDGLVPMLLQSKQKRLEELEALYDIVRDDIAARGGFKVVEPRWVKDLGVVEIVKTDAALLNGARGLLDDIAAEEGARSKGPQQAVNVNVLVRTYDTPGIDPNTV